MHASKLSKLSLWGIIITLGIVYGDLGTSPLYVLRAVVSGTGEISEFTILGGLSCIIWTLTLQTTFKYVFITLRADNKGEGGIFALFSLIRRRFPWFFIFALIGGCTLLADGVITPAITVVSAVEGLKIINPYIEVLPIVLIIITALFFIQQYGTNFLGTSFGPIMLIWFLMLAVLGTYQLIHLPFVLKAFNPYYAINLLINFKGGFLILGAVFLCTTGAEALYSDIGHCGVKNIRVSWIFVKIALILNYLGQGAWLLQNRHIATEINPFYAIMPHWFLFPGIIIATSAAIIASQALISGSFSIINEAITLNFWPKVKVNYTSTIKGQIYIPSINKILWGACVFVIIYFRESANMEAAYGLAITITMLMTTVLMASYLYVKRFSAFIVISFVSIYLIVEGAFLTANLFKFIHGGWVTILIAGMIFFIMFVWYRGRKIKNSLVEYVKIPHYYNLIKDLIKDSSIPKYATNLVYFTRAGFLDEVESKIIYSLISKSPKRADVYWLLHVNVTDEPHTKTYKITPLIPGKLIRIDFRLGFKTPHKINQYFKFVLESMVENKEIDLTSHYASLSKYNIHGDFRFILIDRVQGYDFDFPAFDQFVMDAYEILKKIGIPEAKSFGLDTSNIETEKVPLVVEDISDCKMMRIK